MACRFEVPEAATSDDRAAIEEKIEEIKKRYADGQQVYIDGVSVEYPEYWFNVRASNTEPLVRLNVESRGNEALMHEKTAELLGFLDLLGAQKANH